MEIKIREHTALSLGYENYTSFYESTGLRVDFRTDNLFAFIYNKKDPFYQSYSTSSTIHLDTYDIYTDINPFSCPLKLKELKNKVSAKLRQQRVLESIKQKAIGIITDFISNSFDVKRDLIESSDILFMSYSQFSVANIVFSYSGTIKDEVFEVTGSNYMSYRRAYDLSTTIKDYFNLKQENHDSKY